MEAQQVQPQRGMVKHFEGRPLTVREWRGKPCVVAGEFGSVLGYKQGRALTDKVTGEWSEEFMEGADFAKVEGVDVMALGLDSSDSLESSKALPQRGARSVIVLYESGMYLAAVKARTALGRRVRRWLASEVLPELARTGSYSAPSRQPPPPIPLTLSLDFSTHALLSQTAHLMGAGNTPESIANRVLGMWRTLAVTISPPIVFEAMKQSGLDRDERSERIERNDRTLEQPTQAVQSVPSASSALSKPLKPSRPTAPAVPAPAQQVIVFHPVPPGRSKPILPPPGEPMYTPGGAFHLLLLDGWEAFCAPPPGAPETTYTRRGRPPSAAVSATKVMRHRPASDALPEQLRTAFAMMERAGMPVSAGSIGWALAKFRGVEVDGRYFDKYRTNVANLWRVVRVAATANDGACS